MGVATTSKWPPFASRNATTPRPLDATAACPWPAFAPTAEMRSGSPRGAPSLESVCARTSWAEAGPSVHTRRNRPPGSAAEPRRHRLLPGAARGDEEGAVGAGGFAGLEAHPAHSPRIVGCLALGPRHHHDAIARRDRRRAHHFSLTAEPGEIALRSERRTGSIGLADPERAAAPERDGHARRVGSGLRAPRDFDAFVSFERPELPGGLAAHGRPDDVVLGGAELQGRIEVEGAAAVDGVALLVDVDDERDFALLALDGGHPPDDGRVGLRRRRRRRERREVEVEQRGVVIAGREADGDLVAEGPRFDAGPDDGLGGDDARLARELARAHGGRGGWLGRGGGGVRLREGRDGALRRSDLDTVVAPHGLNDDRDQRGRPRERHAGEEDATSLASRPLLGVGRGGKRRRAPRFLRRREERRREDGRREGAQRQRRAFDVAPRGGPRRRRLGHHDLGAFDGHRPRDVGPQRERQRGRRDLEERHGLLGEGREGRRDGRWKRGHGGRKRGELRLRRRRVGGGRGRDGRELVVRGPRGRCVVRGSRGRRGILVGGLVRARLVGGERDLELDRLELLGQPELGGLGGALLRLLRRGERLRQRRRDRRRTGRTRRRDRKRRRHRAERLRRGVGLRLDDVRGALQMLLDEERAAQLLHVELQRGRRPDLLDSIHGLGVGWRSAPSMRAGEVFFVLVLDTHDRRRSIPFDHARATTACTIAAAPPSLSARVHASIVAPVVRTSSTRRTLRPLTPARGRARKAAATFVARASRSREACCGVSRTRINASGNIGRRSARATGRARSADWLKPRSANRETWSGTWHDHRVAQVFRSRPHLAREQGAERTREIGPSLVLEADERARDRAAVDEHGDGSGIARRVALEGRRTGGAENCDEAHAGVARGAARRRDDGREQVQGSAEGIPERHARPSSAVTARLRAGGPARLRERAADALAQGPRRADHSSAVVA